MVFLVVSFIKCQAKLHRHGHGHGDTAIFEKLGRTRHGHGHGDTAIFEKLGHDTAGTRRLNN